MDAAERERRVHRLEDQRSQRLVAVKRDPEAARADAPVAPRQGRAAHGPRSRCPASRRRTPSEVAGRLSDPAGASTGSPGDIHACVGLLGVRKWGDPERVRRLWPPLRRALPHPARPVNPVGVARRTPCAAAALLKMLCARARRRAARAQWDRRGRTSSPACSLWRATTCSRRLERFFAERRQTGYGPLYDLLADYPFREGKGLRPAICLAAAEPSAAAPTGAEHRDRARAVPQRVPRPRRHRGRLRVPPRPVDAAPGARRADGDQRRRRDQRARHGSPAAQHRDARRAQGLAGASARSSGWPANRPRGRPSSWAGSRGRRFDLGDRDYVRMAYKKTCWYTVIAPLRIGVICGSRRPLAPLEEELRR